MNIYATRVNLKSSMERFIDINRIRHMEVPKFKIQYGEIYRYIYDILKSTN